MSTKTSLRFIIIKKDNLKGSYPYSDRAAVALRCRFPLDEENLYFSLKAFQMDVKFYPPHILLQDFVQSIMVIHAETDNSNGNVVCPYPPTPQNSMFFYINDRIKVQINGQNDFILQPRSVLVGPMMTKVRLDVNRSHKAVRVDFHPGGLHRLLGISMVEMIDGNFDAEDVYGRNIRELNERLQEAETFDVMNDVVEKFLLTQVQKLKRALPFDKAMQELVNQKGNISIEEVASMACISLRQFERVSKERIGIPPKMFARLVRFSKAYRLRENFQDLSWAQIAYDCGYFDQMHFIRDFKEFAGVSPGIIEKELQEAPLRLQAALRF